MTKEEALARVKTGYFGGKHGFDMQLLIDAVGTIGEMLQNGQISEVVRCKDCTYSCDYTDIYIDHAYKCIKNRDYHNDNWFCADGKRK